jgi:copper oxidase (laccase) domain-containing protein
VLLAALDTGAVAAVHAGWRGVVAGVVERALERLASGQVVAAIGPCIGACCFEVGADVGAQIAGACGEAEVVARRVGAKAYVDLRRAVAAQLAKAGVRDIEQVAGCTRCDAARFHSFRRDGAESGRHLAVIALRP